MVYSEKFYVGFSDVGGDLGILNTAILRLFENACCLQGEAVGDGFNDTKGRWFLSAYHVKVLSRPKYGEWVTVNTWSRERKGFSASREFEIFGAEGKPSVIALSNWVRINSETGKTERMADEAFARYESEPERHNFDEAWIQKLRGISEPKLEREFFIDRSMIDPNRHMNNVYYLDLAARTLPEEVFDLGEADEFEITYRKAIAYGETVTCACGEDDEARYVAVKSIDKDETRAIIKLYK